MTGIYKITNAINGAAEAVRAIGKNNPSNIRNVCHGKQKYAYGYFWKYMD